MAINYLEFQERFSGLKPSPVYLFTGEERFFMDEGIRIVRERFLEEGARDFNYDICFASDIEASRVVEMAETLPVMAKYRVVIVKGMDEWSSKEKEIIAAYLNRPSPTTCLILTATKLDRREKFSVTLDKRGTVILCQPLYRQNLTGWIKQRVRRVGKSIDNDALHLLTEIAGDDMLSIDNDIEKLTLYCGDRKNVSLEDVSRVSSSMRSASVFEVANAIVDRRLKDAISSLKRAIHDGEPPVRIFYFIVREFRMMLKAKTLMDAGESPEAAAKAAGIPPFKVKEFSQRVQKFSREELHKLFERLIAVDGRLKGGVLRPEMVLEDLILSVCLRR